MHEGVVVHDCDYDVAVNNVANLVSRVWSIELDLDIRHNRVAPVEKVVEIHRTPVDTSSRCGGLFNYDMRVVRRLMSERHHVRRAKGSGE